MCHLFRNKGQTNPTFHNSVCNAKGKRCLCAVLVMRELTFKVCTGKFRAMLSMIVQIESKISSSLGIFAEMPPIL